MSSLNRKEFEDSENISLAIGQNIFSASPMVLANGFSFINNITLRSIK